MFTDIVESAFKNRRTRFMAVKGDVMAPTIHDGGLVAIVPVSGYRGAGIYALNFLGAALCLYRVEHLGDGRYRLSPDNPDYRSMEIGAIAFEAAVVAKVFGIVTLTDSAVLALLGAA